MQTQSAGTVLSPLTPTTRGKQAKTSVCMCAEEEATICRERQTTETWHRERIPLKMFDFHNILNVFCLTSLHIVISLVKSDTACIACQKLKKNFGRDWECGEDGTSLSQAPVDKHLTYHLHTSVTAQTGGFSKKFSDITTP